MSARKSGGARRMGRPPGTGGPPEKVRRNRVVVMVRDAELAALQRLSEERGLPLGTVAYELLSKALRRAK